jgi:hypothetical protein
VDEKQKQKNTPLRMKFKIRIGEDDCKINHPPLNGKDYKGKISQSLFKN